MLGVLAAAVVVVVVAVALGVQAAEAYHDTNYYERLTPHHTLTQGHYLWNQHWYPPDMIQDIETYVTPSPFDLEHMLPALANTARDGFFPTFYIYLPNQAGGSVTVSYTHLTLPTIYSV